MTSGPRYLLSLLAVLTSFGVPLLVAGIVADGAGPGSGPRTATPRQVVAAVPRIARGVERVRELRFDHLPRPQIISVGQLERIFGGEQRKHADPASDRSDVAALTLLGLLPAGIDLDKLATQIADETAGAYDPQSGRLFILRDSSLANPAVTEFVLSHELDHALDDQNFRLPDLTAISDDRGLAEQALIEGTATEVMILYAQRYIDVGQLLDATSNLLGDGGFGQLPDLIKSEQSFVYLSGRKFVDTLLDLGKGWNLVDIALGSRPPLSTEQVLHPYKYLTYERPQPVRLGARKALRKPWRRLGGAVLGEFDSTQLLRTGVRAGQARQATVGWAGQSLEIWRRGTVPCTAPCRSRDALSAAWRWDSAADARQFDRALGGYLRDGLGADPVSGMAGVWSLHGAWVGTASTSRRSSLAFAPSPRLARQLAGASG